MGIYWKSSGMMLVGVLAMTAQADMGDLPDPTRPHGAAAGGPAPSGVQSILISPQRKVAVVHGRTVTIGVRVGDAVVTDIRPYEVILKRGGRESRLRLVPHLDKARGRVPIFCGGTGLYFKAFLEGLGEAPPASPALRAELEAAPLPELLQELEKRDPATFNKIDRQNPRRVIRAVEVIRLTGKPFSAQRARWGEAADRPPNLSNGSRGRSPHQLTCLTRAAADLHARINARVEKMFAAGLVEETRCLLEHGLAQNKTAMQALGYRQVVEHLRGETAPTRTTAASVHCRRGARR